MKRKLRKKIVIAMIVIIIAIITTLTIIYLNKKDINKVIIGAWTTPGGTIYIFNEDNIGIMRVPLNDYSFSYKIEDNKLIIDFEDESVFDPTYEYVLEKDILTLTGKNGTFIFRKAKFNTSSLK